MQPRKDVKLHTLHGVTLDRRNGLVRVDVIDHQGKRRDLVMTVSEAKTLAEDITSMVDNDEESE